MSADWQALDVVERAELIERLRQTGLRLDKEGRWWHEGIEVAHRGLAAALTRWLDRLEDGRYVVRFDRERYAYVEVEDAPFIVKSVRLERGREGPVHLQLSDGRTEELAYDTLRIGSDNALYCRVGRRFQARFSRQAYYSLTPRISEAPDGFALEARGVSWPIEVLVSRHPEDAE